ncbi:MAG: histidine--tRNA ligase [Epsilonproteobacteria bacterium]|nr:histidine--tRNA ligase [Campylobacterota bacterium]
MIKPLRGMRDLAFEDAKKFEYFIDTATNIAKKYGYEYLETPILEESALFKRSVGESSDIVNKEMYQFIDKGGNDVCLRPEGTAGVVRFFISNKLDRQDGKYKFLYYGPMFRYERPQKGRFREFHQFGCESFGEESVYEDYTIIELISKIFDELNIAYSLEINSLGCSECMPKYKEKLVEFLEDIKDELCEDCQRRIKTNPIRVLDCKNQNCKTALSNAPKITDNLCSSCHSDFEKLKELLENSGIEFSVNKNLVRGLDYYNKSAFEFISSNLGAQNAIAGGGRYDKLVEFLGGKPTAAVGFAIGVERVLELLELPEQKREGYYFGAMSKEGVDKVVKVAKDIRKDNRAFVEFEPKKLKAHLKSADRQNSRYCCIVGEDELKNDTIWVKDLEEKREFIVSSDEFVKNI